MKIRIIILLIFISLSMGITAQTPINLEWSKVMGGSDVEEPHPFADYTVTSSMAVDNEGNIFIASCSNSADGDLKKNHGRTDGWIIKLNASGDTLWTRVFGGSEVDIPKAIVPDNKGGCVVVGFTFSDDGDFLNSGHHGPTTEEDGFVAFFDSKGKITIIKQFGSKSWEATTSTGEVFRIGGKDKFNGLTATSDGNYMAVGSTNSTDGDLLFDEDQFTAGWFFKFTPQGKKISSYKISDETSTGLEHYFFELVDVVQADDGNYVALGTESAPMVLYGTPYWIVKTDGIDNKNKIWTANYSCNGNTEKAISLTKHRKNYTVCGRIAKRDGDVENPIYGKFDTWVFEVDDQDGSILKQNTIGGSDTDVSSDIISLKNGNLLIAGSTISTDFYAQGGYGSTDFWVLELNNNLDTLRMHKFGGSKEDNLSAVAESLDGTALYFTGTTNSNDPADFGYIHENKGDYDLWIGKITADPTLSVQNIQNSHDNIKCFSTNDKGVFNLSGAKNKTITIYNILGKQVLSKQINSDSEQINLSNFAKGIYLINFNDNTTNTVKVINN